MPRRSTPFSIAPFRRAERLVVIPDAGRIVHPSLRIDVVIEQVADFGHKDRQRGSIIAARLQEDFLEPVRSEAAANRGERSLWRHAARMQDRNRALELDDLVDIVVETEKIDRLGDALQVAVADDGIIVEAWQVLGHVARIAALQQGLQEEPVGFAIHRLRRLHVFRRT